jgi:hypothetical protein
LWDNYYYTKYGSKKFEILNKLEDNIRNLYLDWYKLKSKTKGDFIKYLNKNIDKIVNI